jgi:hypothetical protein
MRRINELKILDFEKILFLFVLVHKFKNLTIKPKEKSRNM